MSPESGSEQGALFALPTDRETHWSGMPSYDQRDLMPWHSIKVHFRNYDDMQSFSLLVGQRVYRTTQSIWHPEAEIGRIADKRFVTERPVLPRYPLYVVSKGRWESRLTAKALDAIGVPYRIVVEPQEAESYAAAIGDASKVLILPFSNLGQGSIPARNWIWEHALSEGYPRHWILDDNIGGFYRLTNNLKTPVKTGATFAAAEDFTDRYTNVALSGFNYFMFAKRKDAIPPFVPNTRIYSCILIRNDLPFRWRGRYNEDTDLSLRVLKAGWCTVLFNAFLALKTTTMTMKGGNTDELYQGDGRRLMAESLREQHPDVVTVTQKWGRYQHQVNYRPFRNNRLTLRPDLDAAALARANDYGMTLQVDGDEAA